MSLKKVVGDCVKVLLCVVFVLAGLEVAVRVLRP
jgi:hypothetical protein